jgi:hypothetical protein
LGFHGRYYGVKAVVNSLDIDVDNSLKVSGFGLFEVAHVGYAGVVDQDVEGANFRKNCLYLSVVGYVAGVGGGLSAGGFDGLDYLGSGFGVEFEYVNGSALLSKQKTNGSTYAAAAARYSGYFVV